MDGFLNLKPSLHFFGEVDFDLLQYEKYLYGMHADFQQMLLTFFAGLIFGYIAMEYSLLWSFVLHVFNNFVLGPLWSSWLLTMTETAQNIVAFGILAVLLAVLAVIFVKNRDKTKAYLALNRTQKGTYPRVWSSIWFIGFAVVEGIKALKTINPLHP